MSDPFVRAQGRGCLASIAVQIVSSLVALLLFGGACVVAMFAPDDGSSRLIAFLVAVVVFLGALTVGAFVYVARRTRVFDAPFSALGVAGRSALPNLREYHGAVHGRQLDALYARRGPMLDINLSTPLHTTLAVGTRTGVGTFVADLAGLTEVPMQHDHAFASLVVSADDPSWAQRALAVPDVRDAVLRAVTDPTGRELRVVALRPGAVKLSRRYFVPDACVSEIAPMVALLAQLAASFERLPRPSREVALSPLEHRARTAPMRTAALFVFALLGVLVLVCVALAALAVIAFSNGA